MVEDDPLSIQGCAHNIDIARSLYVILLECKNLQMVSVILMSLITIMAIQPLIIAVCTPIQPSIKIFALQQTVTNNQTHKNTNQTPDNMTTSIINTTQLRRFDNVDSRIEPSDISNGNTSTALSNPQMVINILSSMSPDDISKFPLKDIPTNELLIVLNGLSVQDLFKTLENIPGADLAEIFNNLPQDKSQGILNRLPSDQSQEILDQLTGELTR